MDRIAEARFKRWMDDVSYHLQRAEGSLSAVRGALEDGEDAAKAGTAYAAGLAELIDGFAGVRMLAEAEFAAAVEEFEAIPVGARP